MQKPFLPDKFLSRSKELLGNDYNAFLEASLSKPPKCVRVNTLRVSVSEVKSELSEAGIELAEVPFCSHAFFCDTSKRLGSLLWHALGHYYLQDASSLVPVLCLEPRPNERQLDLAASPGGKATHICQLMHDKGILVAIDSNHERIPALRYNLSRLGVTCCATGIGFAESFDPGMQFDKILLDAPCSTDSLIRQRLDCLKGWSPELVEQKSVLQKKMILNAFSHLKPKGILVYSTCTSAPEENEEVVSHLLENAPDAKIERSEIKGLKSRKGIFGWRRRLFDSRVADCLRILPQDNNTEGFFVAKIRKG
ncbi:MAG: RsmB/NOP family class I SAM-dependent RNA methyltransferase [archaeon]